MSSVPAKFSFGRNWQRFLAILDEERIAEAERSISKMLRVESLRGKTFLDIGSGSGLLSLAAVRLGAVRVHSFDHDSESVACTLEVKHRYCPWADHWSIEIGDVLDKQYLERLGHWDIVYSWGVLHHTGEMWEALNNIIPLVGEHGVLFIAIYNDQGIVTAFWRRVKQLYNQVQRPLQIAMEWGFFGFFACELMLADLFRRRNPLARYSGRGRRGMGIYRDVVDWVGGYPFEVATPEAIFQFYRDRGFTLQALKTCGGKHGCNEFVFSKPPTRALMDASTKG